MSRARNILDIGQDTSRLNCGKEMTQYQYAVILDILSETIVSLPEFLMLTTKASTFGTKLSRAEWIILADELIICGEVYHTPLAGIINNNWGYCRDKDRTELELLTWNYKQNIS